MQTQYNTILTQQGKQIPIDYCEECQCYHTLQITPNGHYVLQCENKILESFPECQKVTTSTFDSNRNSPTHSLNSNSVLSINNHLMPLPQPDPINKMQKNQPVFSTIDSLNSQNKIISELNLDHSPIKNLQQQPRFISKQKLSPSKLNVSKTIRPKPKILGQKSLHTDNINKLSNSKQKIISQVYLDNIKLHASQIDYTNHTIRHQNNRFICAPNNLMIQKVYSLPKSQVNTMNHIENKKSHYFQAFSLQKPVERHKVLTTDTSSPTETPQFGSQSRVSQTQQIPSLSIRRKNIRQKLQLTTKNNIQAIQSIKQQSKPLSQKYQDQYFCCGYLKKC